MSATGILAAQHRAIEALFDDLTADRGGSTRSRARSRALSVLAEELIAHMAAEEAVFYPVARRALGSDRVAARRLRGQHVELRAQLRRVLETSVGHPSLDARCHRLQTLFDNHVDVEEKELFPNVEAVLEAGDLDVLGSQLLAARPPIWIVTTERHPLVPPADGRMLRSRVSVPLPPSRG